MLLSADRLPQPNYPNLQHEAWVNFSSRSMPLPLTSLDKCEFIFPCSWKPLPLRWANNAPSLVIINIFIPSIHLQPHRILSPRFHLSTVSTAVFADTSLPTGLPENAARAHATGFAPTAQMTNSPCRAGDHRGEGKRWGGEDKGPRRLMRCPCSVFCASLSGLWFKSRASVLGGRLQTPRSFIRV